MTLDSHKRIHLLELFHGPTFAFKDVALQFLGNLFEFFLVRRNKGKTGKDREHLTVIGATSGDTGKSIARFNFKLGGQITKVLDKGSADTA